MSREGNNGSLLSKSLYLKGLRCYKSLYLNKHHPELRDEPHVSRETRRRNDAKVSLCARGLFPGGAQIPRGEGKKKEATSRTVEEILQGADTLYDAAFEHEGLFVRVDILRWERGGWRIYEVKDAARVKDLYVDDVAMQYFVLRGSLLPVTKAHVIHINRDFTRNDTIDVRELFTIVDITEEVVEKQHFVASESERQKEILNGPMPDLDIGRQCTDIEDCGFKNFCWQHIPEDSIFSLRGKGVDKLVLYKQGIVHLRDAPLKQMPFHQRLQTVATLKKKNFINKKRVRDFLSSIWHPLCFLDFETFMDPIPPFEKTRPYQQIPFQYSLHYQEDGRAKIQHREFLARPAIDERKGIALKLIDEIPEGACVLVYGRSFETEVLRDLARRFPALETKIEAIIGNIVDLAVPFRRRDVYFWEMRGKTSIKAVLPALVPGLGYEGLEISDGGSAMEAYYAMSLSENDKEIERIRRSLLAYCRLDTLAMVKILSTLRRCTA